ncbi:unnamed protein product [Rotaria sp. Silwood1]|nr:unnamed protein product [Rotaria sp. Silwood1]CAF1681878.1 unnamed protein product [Rotaria sp. Silwood1]
MGSIKQGSNLRIIHVKQIEPPVTLIRPPFEATISTNSNSYKIQAVNDDFNQMNLHGEGDSKATQAPPPAVAKSKPVAAAAASVPPPTQKKDEGCGGNACPKCGKCRDWYYDRNIDRDLQRWKCDSNCDEIFDENNWHRRSGATCTVSAFDDGQRVVYYVFCYHNILSFHLTNAYDGHHHASFRDNHHAINYYGDRKNILNSPGGHIDHVNHHNIYGDCVGGHNVCTCKSS